MSMCGAAHSTAPEASVVEQCVEQRCAAGLPSALDPYVGGWVGSPVVQRCVRDHNRKPTESCGPCRGPPRTCLRSADRHTNNAGRARPAVLGRLRRALTRQSLARPSRL